MRRRRSPARWLAPIALVACALAVYSVVNATLSSDEPTNASTASTSSTTRSKTASDGSGTTTTTRRTKRRRAYTVKSGDTLSSIALKTGVSLERIQALNPKHDSQSLQTPPRVKLTP